VRFQDFTKRDNIDGTVDNLNNTETLKGDVNDIFARDPQKGKGKKGWGKKKNVVSSTAEDQSVNNFGTEDSADDTSDDLIARDPTKGKGKKG
jgi:hypothetical protein